MDTSLEMYKEMYKHMCVRIDADEGRLGAALAQLAQAQSMILDAVSELRSLGVLHLVTEEETAGNS